MAEVTAIRNNALPYPVYGAPWTLVFPILDADGDLVTGATTPDAEVSKNGDTFADCTNESTEIATSSGMYYLTLTGTEMTADIVSVIAKCATTGAKTTPLVMYPRKLVTLRTGTAQGGAAGYITLDASAGSINDMWNGCLCVATIDSNIEARIINDYNGSNQQASVTPNWNVTPDSDDTFTIYLPEGMQIPTVNATHLAGTALTGRDIGASVLLSPGTETGQISLTSGAVTAGSLGTQAKADVNAEVVDVLRTDTLPDDYAAHETQPTIAEAVLAIHQFLFERSVSGTSITVQKPDGTTTAMTLTLDDGTNPTSVHRSA